MKTLRLPLLLIMFFTLSSLLHAQGRGENIDALHTSYITEKLNLTSDEAKKFWPVYDEYRSAKDELKKQRKSNNEMVRKAGGIDNMSEADVQKLIASESDVKTRELEVDKQYVTKFEQVLPIRKVAKFYIAEEEFKLYLLKQLGNRRGAGGMNRREPEFVPQ
jgi:hypothetical protein